VWPLIYRILITDFLRKFLCYLRSIAACILTLKRFVSHMQDVRTARPQKSFFFIQATRTRIPFLKTRKKKPQNLRSFIILSLLVHIIYTSYIKYALNLNPPFRAVATLLQSLQINRLFCGMRDLTKVRSRRSLSERLVDSHSIWSQVPEDWNLHQHHCG